MGLRDTSYTLNSDMADEKHDMPTTSTKPTLNDATANFAVICQGRCYMTHKQVLEKASPYFERMFRFNGVEANENEISFSDVHMYLMKHILDFMYSGQYILRGGTAVPPGYCNHTTAALRDGPAKGPAIFKRKCPCSGKLLCPSHLISHIRIYEVADYFRMDDLKSYAREGTQDVLHVYWDAEELGLADALEEAFTSTLEEDRGIKDVLVDILKEHPGLWVDEGDVQEWLDDNPKVLEAVDCDPLIPPMELVKRSYR